MTILISGQNSEYSTCILDNAFASNPDGAILSVIDRMLHSIPEISESSIVEISDSRNEMESSLITDMRELISELENDRISSESSSRQYVHVFKYDIYGDCYKFISHSCAQLSQNSNSREDTSSKKRSRPRSSYLISKNGSVETFENSKSSSITQDPIRSISITSKVKDLTRSTNKCKLFSLQ